MRIIARKALCDFWGEYPDSEQALKSWFKDVKKSTWNCHVDALTMFPTARAIGSNRLVFKIKGNKYRLVVSVHYSKQIVFIRFIGKHERYDRIDALTI